MVSMWSIIISSACIYCVLVINANASILDPINLNEYYKMPSLTVLDSYSRCMHNDNANMSIYCIVKTKIKPDPNNEVWNIIKEHTSNIFFRHDVLTRGICVDKCLETLLTLNDSVKENLYIDDFSDEDFTYGLENIKDSKYYRAVFGELLNVCVSLPLMKEYNLKGYSTINYCTSEKEDYSYDNLDKAFVALVVLICLITVLGSYLDEPNFDAIKEKCVATRIFQKFSVHRNFQQCASGPSETPLSQDLKFTEGLRLLAMVCIVFLHVDMGLSRVLSNPEEIEGLVRKPTPHLIQNATLFVQLFFVLSGALLSITFIDKYINKRKYNSGYFWLEVIGRYIRLTPVYAFILFFEATLMNKSSHGPFWKSIGENERNVCRKNWWLNLLYVNNYFNIKHGCMLHTWYLAVDMQVFLIGTIMMMLIWKYPKSKNWILGIVVTVAIIIPGIVTYFYEFEAVFILPLEYRREVSTWRSFEKLYVQTHVNAGNYFIGMICGFLYHKYKERRFDPVFLRHLRILLVIFTIISVINLQLTWIFYVHKFEKPALWIAIYAVVARHLWGVFFSLIILAACFKASSGLNRFFGWSTFQLLGRITYCIYLIHVPLLGVMGGSILETVSVNVAVTLSFGLSLLLLCFFLGFVFSVGLELPFIGLKDMLLQSYRNKIEQQNQEETKVTDIKEKDIK